jgi:hypothetical protein
MATCLCPRNCWMLREVRSGLEKVGREGSLAGLVMLAARAAWRTARELRAWWRKQLALA